MAEPEIGTKAPESDAHEPSLISQEDSKAQTGASMGEHCTTDRPAPSGQHPGGEITKYSETEVYVSKPADYPNAPGKLLLLLTGGTGVHSVNNQLQADMFAAKGFVVVMPDMFAGDPAPNSKPQDADPDPSFIEQVKMRAAETAKSFLIDMWLARHTPEKVLPIIQKVLDTAKDEYADAVATGGGVYAVGYCIGAKYVLLLAGDNADTATLKEAGKDDEEAGMVQKGPLIKAGALAHASLVDREDFIQVKAPLTLACVEDDPLFPAEILEDGRKHFASSKVEHEIKTYSGVPHGFAVVGEYDSSKIKEAQSEAFIQMLNWLQSH